MVLSASTADHRAGTPDWLRRVTRSLRLSSDKVIVLATGGVGARLRELVLALLDVDDRLRMPARVQELVDVPAGSLVLLAPRATDTSWLNFERPLFAERRLRVVLWADDEVTLALKRGAPDFFDWISHVVQCPSEAAARVPGFAAAGLTAAPDYPGVAWQGSDVDAALDMAYPGENTNVVRAAAQGPYGSLVEAARRDDAPWLVFTGAESTRDVTRVRWALAESGWRGRCVLERPGAVAPGWWPASDVVMDVHDAAERLQAGYGEHAALIAALLDLEPGAVELACRLHPGVAVALIGRLRGAADPGAELARDAWAQGLVDAAGVARWLVDARSTDTLDSTARMPVLRALHGEPAVTAYRAEACARTASRLATVSHSEQAPAELPSVEDMILWANSCPLDPPPVPGQWLPGIDYWLEAALRSAVEPAAWGPIISLALDLGQLDAAEHWLDKSEKSQPHQQARIPDDLDGNAELRLRGRLYKLQGKYGQAEDLLRQSLASIEKALGREHPGYGASLHALADILLRKGNYQQAEVLLRQSLSIQEKTLGREHPSYGVSLYSQAEVLKAQGKYEQAEDLFRQSLAITERVMGHEHPSYGASLYSLAQVLEAQAKYKQAEELLRRSLAIAEKALGGEHPDYSETLQSLANVLFAQDEYQEAEALLRQSLAIMENTLGREHPSFAASLGSLASVLDAQGKYTQAEDLLRQSLAIHDKALGREHPHYGAALCSLANILLAQGKHEQAEALLQQSLAIREMALGSEHPALCPTLGSLAIIRMMRGRIEEAAALLQRAHAIAQRSFGPAHPTTQAIEGLQSELGLLAR